MDKTKTLVSENTQSEFEELQRTDPKLYDAICIKVGEYVLNKKGIIIGVALPHKEDFACVSLMDRIGDISVLVDSKIIHKGGE